jgi:hypothetical protein
MRCEWLRSSVYVCVRECVERAAWWRDVRFWKGTYTRTRMHTHTVELPSTAAVCDIDGVRTLEEMQFARGGAHCADLGWSVREDLVCEEQQHKK